MSNAISPFLQVSSIFFPVLRYQKYQGTDAKTRERAETRVDLAGQVSFRFYETYFFFSLVCVNLNWRSIRCVFLSLDFFFLFRHWTHARRPVQPNRRTLHLLCARQLLQGTAMCDSNLPLLSFSLPPDFLYLFDLAPLCNPRAVFVFVCFDSSPSTKL